MSYEGSELSFKSDELSSALLDPSSFFVFFITLDIETPRRDILLHIYEYNVAAHTVRV